MTSLYAGRVVMTQHIANVLGENDSFIDEIDKCFWKHITGDFSGMEFEEDRKLNEVAFKTGDGRVFTDFQTSFGKIWIITDQRENPLDNTTTILFPEDY